MQLALDMGMTLTELNSRMSSSEFTLWQAFHQLQPRGVKRDNWHSAQICHLLASIHAPKGKKFKVDDFMYKDSESVQQDKTSQFISKLNALAKPKQK